MAVLEVVKAGHPILKEVAEPVEHVNKKMRALIEDMADTMYKTEGVGLAAPSVLYIVSTKSFFISFRICYNN